MNTVKIKRGNEFKAFHNADMPYYTAWNELMDNSIDNGATEIRFDFDEESVTIIDNGTGIADNDQAVAEVLHFYESVSKDDITKIGNYGIGLKEATMRLGNGILIRTKAKGSSPIEIDVPWYKGVDEVQYITIDNDIKEGCSIQIYDDTTVPKPNVNSFRFYDKLVKSGKLTIYDCDGKKYVPVIDPIFEGKTQELQNVSIAGRKCNVKIGILSKTVKSSGGFYVYSVEQLRYYHYGQAVIGNEVSARDRLYVEIGLINAKTDWIADKNKKGILDIDLIAGYLDAPRYLGRWRQKLYNDKTNNVVMEIEDKLNESFGLDPVEIGEEVRKKIEDNNPEKQKGTIEKSNSGKKRKRATKVREHNIKNVQRKFKGELKGVKIVVANFSTPHSYLTISYEQKKMIIRINKNNTLMEMLLSKTTDAKKNMLNHLIHIGIQANSIKENELQFKSAIDIIMCQHENIDKY